MTNRILPVIHGALGAGLLFLSLVCSESYAQIVPSGAHAPNLINTASGLPQVNITRPSAAGVSLNTYSRFDVQKAGAILNNSPVIVNTQLAGQISGNPNYGANDAAKVIVNQVNSNNPSQLGGYVEVAGQKADVVIANPSGLVVDGGGFINTARGILSTGNAQIDANGRLAGFNVTGGTITVQGAGLNGANIDEVDLIARAVQANAAIYANALNVVTGANSVDYASLGATPVAGNGAAPGVSIDVAQLGGMYANRITLVGTENGVGVANAGTIAAQGGDLNLTASGQLVQAGQMEASGNVALGAGSVNNSGTIYAKQGASVSTAGALQNSGLLAAQQDTTVNAGSVASTGALGAGVNSDGTLGSSGDLTVSASGSLAASGQNVAGGNATLMGSSVNLAGSQTVAGGNLTLKATAGDLNLAGANTGAGATVVASATGMLDNTAGSIQGGQLSLEAANLVNQGGTITQTGSGAMTVNVSGTLDNSAGGTLQAGGTLTTHSDTLENTGSIVGGSVSLNATQSLTNVGAAALIGATDSSGTLEILSPDIENRDDTTATDTQASTAIYGLGSVVLAGGKDASGNYTNANLIHNQSALIESSGDMALYANQLTNTRRVMTTSGYTQPADASQVAQLGVSLSGCTAIYSAACSGQEVPWSATGDPTMIGGAFTTPPNGGQWNSGYQYTTYTGVALQSAITATSPSAQIIAGGNLGASNVGLLQNYWSQVAAGGNIAMPATLDQDSWAGQVAPGVQVTYSGEYHYNNYDDSEHDWQLPFGNAPFVGGRPGGYAQAAPADIRTYALPAGESTFAADSALTGTGVSINNTAGNAGLAGAATVGAVTAQNVLANLSLPKGGLFHVNTAPNAPYLIESNPAFTSAQSFISSDYYLKQIGYDPQTVEKRLGDGMYEQQLVEDQLTSLTGRAVPGPYTDAQSMYEALMSAGATLAQSLNLPLGMGLSAQQVAALTSNVVIMQTQVVDGQSVLVPVVYLAQASAQNMQGPLIAAGSIDLQGAQTFTNSGTVQATDSLTISAQSINSTDGTLQSGGLMNLNTTGDVNLTSATVNAGSLALNAGGNLLLNTATNTLNQVSATGATRTSTTLGPQAQINVTGDASITTGGNFEQNAGALNVGGNLGMAVGGDWNLGAVQTGEHKVVERANGVSDTDINRVTGSTVKVGGVSNIGVNGDLNAQGANINLAGGGTIAAGGTVNLGVASATSTINSNSSGSDHHGSYAESLHSTDEQVTGTTLTAGNTLNVAAGKDIDVTGSTVSLKQGEASLVAGGSVNIGAATQTQTLDTQETHSHGNVVSHTQVQSSLDSTATQSIGSTVSADAVTIASGHDINVQGSTVVGTNDVNLAAGHDVNITTSQDTQDAQSYYKKSQSGLLSNGGLSITIGARSMADRQTFSQVTNNAGMVGSLNGNVNLSAGNELHMTGSTLYAGGDANASGQSVAIDAAHDTTTQTEQQQYRQAGLTVGLTSPVLSAIQTGIQMAKAAKQSGGDTRTLALAAATTALAAKNAYDAVGGNPVTAATTVGINISLGASKSDSQSQAQSDTAVGSTVKTGHDLNITASGAGANSNIDVVGGTLTAANNATLAAEGSVNLEAAQSTSSLHSTSSSASGGIGVSLTLGSQNGLAFTAGASGSRGNAQGNSTTWSNTNVGAGNTLTLQSGGDTNLKGATASGQQVVADVGGNLNIESLQDTSHYDAKQQSAGVSISVCVPPLCVGASSVMASLGQTKMNSDYASVGEQSGILAGSNGFDVNVAGNTDLKGAVIASTADATQNSLSTGSLTHSDIQNTASYDAQQLGLSGGYSFGNTSAGSGAGKNQQGQADNVNPVPGTTLPGYHGVSVAPPMALGASGDANSTTRSAISAGALTITNAAAQQQQSGQTADEAAAGISRDTSNTQATIAPIFNQDRIEAGFEVAGQFANQVNTFVATRMKESDDAQKALDAEEAKPADQQDAAKIAQLEQTVQDDATWESGGAGRLVLTALTGAAGSNVTGSLGSLVQGAAVNYLQGLATQQVKDIADDLHSETARTALQGLVACAGAAAQGNGCGAAAAGAAASVVINDLLNGLNDESASSLTQEQKQAREQIVESLVAGVTGALGGDAATATLAAQIETENNGLTNSLSKKYSYVEKQKQACQGQPLSCYRKVLAVTEQAYEQAQQDVKASCGAGGNASACRAARYDVGKLKHDGFWLNYELQSTPDCQSVKCVALTTGLTDLGGVVAGEVVGAVAGKAATAAFSDTAGSNVWGLNPIARGVTIESQLAQTEYSAANGWYQVGAENNGYFPLVDFQNGNTLVSLKTVDTTGSTWLPRMENVIDQLGSSNATVNGSPANMVLDLRVQPGGAAAAQRLINYGARQGVTVRIKVYP